MKTIKQITAEQAARAGAGEGSSNDRALQAGLFNSSETLFVKIEPGAVQTISAQLPSGEYVTFSFMPSASDPCGFECVDIHSTVHPKGKNRNGDRDWAHHVLGFDCGGTPLDSRKPDQVKRPIGLLSLLLSKGHYQAAV